MEECPKRDCEEVTADISTGTVEIKILPEVAEHLGHDLLAGKGTVGFVLLRAFPKAKGISAFVLVIKQDSK
jgi:hypothetical protein